MNKYEDALDWLIWHCIAKVLPSKKTCYHMIIASQITDTNIQNAEDVIKDSVDYIFEKINER